MECTSRLEQLSLLDKDHSSSVAPKEGHSVHLPFKQSIVAAKVDGKHTDVILSEYSNRILIVITQCKKVASFISVCKDITPEGCGTREEVYVVRTIFGTQLEESQELVARFLAEETKLTKPAIFALGLQEHGPRTVRGLASIVNAHKSW